MPFPDCGEQEGVEFREKGHDRSDMRIVLQVGVIRHRHANGIERKFLENKDAVVTQHADDVAPQRAVHQNSTKKGRLWTVATGFGMPEACGGWFRGVHECPIVVRQAVPTVKSELSEVAWLIEDNNAELQEWADPIDEEFRCHIAAACGWRGTRRLSIALMYCTLVSTFSYIGQPVSGPLLK